MKKLILVLALTLAAILTLSSCKGEVGTPLGFQKASDTKIVDYHLFVPDDWTVDQSGSVVAAYRSPSDPTSVSVMAWGMEYADSTVDDWWNTYRPEFESIYADFTLESSESTLLDGTAAMKYVYTGRLGEITYRYSQIAAVRHTAVYVITMTELADSPDAETHAAELADIISYFRWE